MPSKAIKKEDDAPDMKKQKISIKHPKVESTTADVADVAPCPEESLKVHVRNGRACPRCAVRIAHDCTVHPDADVVRHISGVRCHLGCWLAHVQQQKKGRVDKSV